MSDFINLTCPTCGAKLQVTSDIERFSCAHCGNEHIIQRAGGIVTIAPIVAEIKKIKAEMNKAASELAMQRLKNDLKENHALIQRERRRLRASLKAIIYVIILLVVGGFSLFFDSIFIGVIGLTLGVLFAIVLVVIISNTRKNIRGYEEDIDSIKKELISCMRAIKIMNQEIT